MSVEIPKCAIAFGAVTPPQTDVIDLKVHLGCTKEVSSFECLLQNWDKKYSPGGTSPINVGMDGHIDMGRGTNVPQIITCRVESVKCESTPNENYIRISGRCWGERLFRRVVTKTYENQKGEAIIKDLLDYYVGLSHVRNSTELVETTDTTFSKLEYENTPVWDILKYVAESSDKAGVIGFDFRVAPDGKFEFFPKLSKTSPVSLSDKIEASEYQKDIHRIRNKILVYGLADKSAPLDQDAWTESLTPADGVWSIYGGNGTLSFDTSSKVKGTGSIKGTKTSTSTDFLLFVFTLNSGKEVDANLYQTLNFFSALGRKFRGTCQIQLEDNIGGVGHTIWKEITVRADLAWMKSEVRVGAGNKIDWTDNSGLWIFDWAHIKKVSIGFFTTSFGDLDSAWIDALYFGGRRFSATREDTASQTAYGLRELTETDEELISDNECDLRAKSLLDYFKDPAEYLTIRSTVVDYGSTPLLPGDKIHVILPNENVDSDFRIESVEYAVDAKTQTLEVSLELGKVPPLLADYLYGLRATTVTVEKLARTKLGKKGIPQTSMSGGIGSHHVAHEVGDGLTAAKWPTDAAGGWDKITGWIAPRMIGPYDDDHPNDPLIINFRTRNKAGTTPLNHQFQPWDDEYGCLGHENKKWKEVHAKYLLLYTDGYVRIKTVGESNPKAQLSSDMIQFGPGGSSALDTWLKRVGAGQLELRYDLLPTADNSGYIGSETKRFAKIYAMEIAVSNMLFNFHLIPDADNTYDLGSTSKKWSNIYANGLCRVGWLNIGDYTVITSARVLQNVTADAAIITSGQFSLARLPRGTSGYVLEAQGANYDPMYVNPHGRYAPAGHSHAAGDVTSGVFDEARIPTVFANARIFNGGITLGAALNMNSQAIQNLASLNQAMPPGANQGAVGTTTTYWNVIAGNSVWYKALGQFDMLDDLALIKKIKGSGKVDQHGTPLADHESLPDVVKENDLINAGALMGLLIGAVKQLAAKVEFLEQKLEKAKKGVEA